MKTQLYEFWDKIEKKYKGKLKGNIPLGTILAWFNNPGAPTSLLKQYKPYRKYHKY